LGPVAAYCRYRGLARIPKSGFAENARADGALAASGLSLALLATNVALDNRSAEVNEIGRSSTDSTRLNANLALRLTEGDRGQWRIAQLGVDNSWDDRSCLCSPRVAWYVSPSPFHSEESFEPYTLVAPVLEPLRKTVL